jgi:hypothetical protein
MGLIGTKILFDRHPRQKMHRLSTGFSTFGTKKSSKNTQKNHDSADVSKIFQVFRAKFSFGLIPVEGCGLLWSIRSGLWSERDDQYHFIDGTVSADH